MKKDIEWLKSWFDDDKSYTGEYVKFKINNIYNAKNLSQKAPVSPQEDEFITECKLKGYSLHAFVHCAEVNDENCERLTRAWLDGYEVEDEQKYYVIDKEDNILLIRGYGGIEKADNLKITNSGGGALKLTEQEIKDFDLRYWAFRKPIDKTVNESVKDEGKI